MGGCLSYRAPEMVVGAPHSYPLDVWALGSVLYYMFTAQRLFEEAEARPAHVMHNTVAVVVLYVLLMYRWLFCMYSVCTVLCDMLTRTPIRRSRRRSATRRGLWSRVASP